MAQADTGAEAPEKKSKLPLIIGLVLALAGAGGGFFVTYSGLLDSLLGSTGGAAADHGGDAAGGGHGAPADEGSAAAGGHGAPAEDAGHGGDSGADAGGATGNYVALSPIIVSLGTRGESQHLRFTAQLEVTPGSAGTVQALTPRILDVLNIYLRALSPQELEEPSALMRLRGQMLRRVQIVAGPGLVSDLLIIEFVFN